MFLLLSARTAFAEDGCPCPPEHRSCQQAANAVEEAVSNGIGTLQQLRDSGRVTTLVRAFAELRSVELDASSGARSPRLYNYLANSALMLEDLVDAVRYARMALEYAKGEAVRCQLSPDKVSTLHGILEFSRSQIIPVTLDVKFSSGLESPIRPKARLSLAISDDGDLEYEPLLLEDRKYAFNPGTQVLTIEAPGYVRHEQVVDVGAELAPIMVTLVPEPAKLAPPPPVGPPTTVPRVASRAPSGPPLSRESHTRPNAGPNAWSYLEWIGGGAALAGGLVAGAVSLIAFEDFQDMNDELEAMCPADKCSSQAEVIRYAELQQEAKTKRTLGIASGVTCGVLVVTGGFFIVRRLLATGKAQAAAPQAALVLDVPTGGVSVGFRSTW